MGDKTGIEWADATWNPIVGCSLVSPGCTNCYAMRQAARLLDKDGSHYAGTTNGAAKNPVWTGKVAIAPDETLTAPIRWKRPRRIFVNSMGDLFHENVPDAWIDRVFAVMAQATQHTFIVLTKRSKRMREYMNDPELNDRLSDAIGGICDGGWLPLANVWVGVSAEDQTRADERIPDLLATPAAKRLISAEPLLGLIDFTPKVDWIYQELSTWYGPDGFDKTGSQPRRERRQGYFPRVDWIIVGGESGKGARPMHPDWARSVRDQCAAADVPFFFKQWGEWLDERVATAAHMAPGPEMFDRFGRPKGDRWHFYNSNDRTGDAMIRVGKKRAGSLLDGVEHKAFPNV